MANPGVSGWVCEKLMLIIDHCSRFKITYAQSHLSGEKGAPNLISALLQYSSLSLVTRS